MSHKTKSISELVTELQKENESLQPLKKFFNQACKNEFGYEVKAIHQIIEKYKLLEQKIPDRRGQQSTFSQSEM